MVCPRCGAKTRVVDSRYVESKKVQRRMRVCPNCGFSSMTQEWYIQDLNKTLSGEPKVIWSTANKLLDAGAELMRLRKDLLELIKK